MADTASTVLEGASTVSVRRRVSTTRVVTGSIRGASGSIRAVADSVAASSSPTIYPIRTSSNRAAGRHTVEGRAEMLVAPIRGGREEPTHAALREMLVEAVPLDHRSAVTLAELRARTNLKLPDCCVLHAAQTVRATRVLTFDTRLAAAARELGIDAG